MFIIINGGIMQDKLQGVRKWFGFIMILGVLYLGAQYLDNTTYGIYSKYAFYAFLVFVGGNTVEHVKEIIGNLKK